MDYRVIETPDQLSTLQSGTVLKDADNNVLSLWPWFITACGKQWAVLGLTKWEPTGMNEEYGQPTLPALVLWEPDGVTL